MDDTEESGRRRRLLAALDNVRESQELLREAFDAEACADLLEWLKASEYELRAWVAAVKRSQHLH